MNLGVVREEQVMVSQGTKKGWTTYLQRQINLRENVANLVKSNWYNACFPKCHIDCKRSKPTKDRGEVESLGLRALAAQGISGS